MPLRAERERCDSDELFRLAVETIADHSIVILDADGRVSTWNAGAQRITGYAAGKILGAAYARFFAPEDCQQRLPERTLMQAARARVRLDGWRLRSNGERYWAEAVLHPLRAGGGPLRGYAEVLRDASAARAHLDALRESQARFSGILESAMDAVISIDDAQSIVLANAAAERLFGWPREALLGMPLARLLPERLRASHAVQVARYAEAGSGSRRMGGQKRMRALRADGGEFPIEASISRVSLGSKRLLTVIVRDITERIAAEEEIQRLNRDLEARVEARTAELRHSVRELESFSYAVSHDLRAPLRALDAFSTRLVRDHGNQLDAEAGRMLQRLRANARQMGGLVDALLTFTRLGRVELACNLVDMGALAREAAGLAQREFPASRFVIGELPPAWGDAALLRQVWANLAHNAAKFSARVASPRIDVGAQSDGKITYYLADNGAGFDPAHAGKLFGVFQRLHGASEFEGTGAGLAIVKRILERHGGWIEAGGRVGEGARFAFGLPERATPA